MNWKLNSIVSVARGRGAVAGERVRRRSAWRSLIAPVVTVCLCGPMTVAWASPAIPQAALASGATPSTQPPRSSTQSVSTGTAQDSAYAAREGESKDLETFKGGEPVVIVTSTAVLIIAIILLIVLI